METLKVFDTSLYKDLSQNASGVIAEDLAGMMIEAGEGPLEKRINPRKFRIVNGEIIDEVSGEKLELNWGYSTVLQRLESTSAEKFYNHLLLSPNSLVISISPSGGNSPYKEARINVGYRSKDEIEFYGIPSHMSPESCLYYADRLLEFSSLQFYSKNPNDLREIAIPISLPNDINPYRFLSLVAPLDSKAWEEILSGSPWILKKQALDDAKEIAPETAQRIKNSKTQKQFIYAGARAEKFMLDKGWKLNDLACPGKFNMDLMRQNGFTYNPFTFDVFGNTRQVSKEKYFSCPKCEGPIESGKGITKCPHCGITKEEAGSKCV